MRLIGKESIFVLPTDDIPAPERVAMIEGAIEGSIQFQYRTGHAWAPKAPDMPCGLEREGEDLSQLAWRAFNMGVSYTHRYHTNRYRSGWANNDVFQAYDGATDERFYAVRLASGTDYPFDPIGRTDWSWRTGMHDALRQMQAPIGYPLFGTLLLWLAADTSIDPLHRPDFGVTPELFGLKPSAPAAAPDSLLSEKPGPQLQPLRRSHLRLVGLMLKNRRCFVGHWPRSGYNGR